MSNSDQSGLFAENVARLVNPDPSIGAIKLSLEGSLIRVVADIPGQSASMKILSAVQREGIIDSKAASQALKVFEPLIPEAQATPGKHPTIDLLLGLGPDQILEIQRVHTPVGLFSKLLNGSATSDEKQQGVMLLDQGDIRCAERLRNYRVLEGRMALLDSYTWSPQSYSVACMNGAFSAYPMQRIGDYFYDKVPLKTEGWSDLDFERSGVRFIPGSFVRRGAYLGAGTTVMPGGIVNTGAFVAGAGVMIDGGARVATGAQIGKGVKLGAGSGVEGILEPAGRLPSIIEDNVRVGANCEITGIIEEGAVIASGVVMASGKKIFDLRTNSLVEPKYISVDQKIFEVPVIPTNRVAVGGVYFKDGQRFGTDCVLLLEKSASETSLAQLPRDMQLYLKV